MRTHLDTRLTFPLAAPGAAASRCVSSVSSGVFTRMPVIAFNGVIDDGPNHPYALARRPMR